MISFDGDFWKAALKEQAAVVFLLLTLCTLKFVGLLEPELMTEPLKIGAFISGIVLVLVTIMVYFQNVSRLIKSNSSSHIKDVLENTKRIEAKILDTFNIVSSHSNQSNQMHYLIMNVYEVVKGIPNKNLIFESLLIRTRYLLNDILEPILEYTVVAATPMSPDTIARIQSKLDRQLTKIKVDYIESIDKLSKNILKVEVKLELEDILDKKLSNLYNIITEVNSEISDILFKVNSELKNLEDILKTTFKDSLNSTVLTTLKDYD